MAESRLDSGAAEDNGLPPVSTGRQIVALSARVNKYVEQPLIVMLVFLVFVVAWYMNWGARRGFFAAMRFEFVVAWFLLLACSILVSNGRINFTQSRPVLMATGTLLLFMVVQVPFAADPDMAKFIFFDRGVFKFSMMAFFIVVMVQSPRTLLWFLLAYLFACLYVTQESVQGLISGGLYWENQGVMRLHGSVRMYAHPNSLAGLAMGVVPFVAFLFPVVRPKFIRLPLLVVCSTSLVCVIYSGSRTAYVAIIAFLLFWWGTSRHKVRFLLICLAALVIAYPAIPAEYRDRFKSITGDEAQGHSKQSRILILEDAWDIFLSNPAGVGLASFPAVRMQRFGRKQDTHNLYFEIVTNLGVQGLVAFFAFIFFLFRGNLYAYRFYERQTRRFAPYLKRSGLSPPVRKALIQFDSDLKFLSAVVKSVAGFVFVRLMLGFFGMDMYEVYWWFAVGLTVVLLNMMSSVGTRAKLLAHLIESDLQRNAKS